MKKIGLVLSAVALLSYQVAHSQEFAGGEGTMENPYQIATAEHLNNVRSR